MKKNLRTGEITEPLLMNRDSTAVDPEEDTNDIPLPSVEDSPDSSWGLLYDSQVEFQKSVTEMIGGLPADNIHWFGYHVRAMVEELGELLSADKRWKTHRNIHFDREEKLDELADVFITAMNLGIFSGISAQELYDHIETKIRKNTEKWWAKENANNI